MKKILSVVLLASALSFGFTLAHSDKDDAEKMVGSWQGSEEDAQQEGLTKHWVQQRDKNGTFTLLFTMIKDCKVKHFAEKGKWAIKDGLFDEYHEDGKTDIYHYEIIDNEHIKFRAKKMTVDMNDENYEFVDTRL